MKIYRVMVTKTRSVMKIWGDNEDEARNNAHDQLNRPGRIGIYRQWLANDQHLIEVGGFEKSQE